MSDMAVPYTQHRFTVDEYHRLADAAVLPHDARIELIDGELVETLVAMKPPHAASVRALTRLLTVSVGQRASVQFQLPVTLGDLSEPEPDIAIVRRPESAYATRHPGPADILTLIEVAESSRAFDLQRKVPLYAAFGVADVWIVDLVDRCVRVFREPQNRVYASVTTLAGDAVLGPLAFDDIRLRVAEVLF